MAVAKLPSAKNKAASQPNLQVVSIENSTLIGQRQFERYNPDQLSNRKGGLALYKKMLDDEQVKAVVDFKRAATLGNGWQFAFDEDVNLSSDERELRINVMDAMLCNFRGSFTDAMAAILRGTAYGYSLTEKVFDNFDFEGKTYVGVAAMLPRNVETFRFYTDEFGVLRRFVQRSGGVETELDYNRFVHYVRAPEVDPYYGESDLRAAYRAWYMKDTKLKFWAQYLERFAGGFAVVSLGDSGVMPGTPDYAALQSMLTNLRGTMGAILPRGVTMEMHHASPTDAYQKAIEFHDLAIAKALLIPNLLGLSNTGNTGAYAQSQTQLEVFFVTLAADLRRLEHVLNDQLFKGIGLRNWDDGIVPSFKLRTTSGDQLRWIVSTWQSLVGAKIVVPTEEDEDYLRRLLEMPPRTEEDTPLQTPQDAQAMEQSAQNQDLAVAAQEHQQGMDKAALEVGKPAPDKAKFSADIDVDSIVRDELAKLLAGEGARLYRGAHSPAVFEALRNVEIGDIITDPDPIPMTESYSKAIRDAGSEREASVLLSVRSASFMAQIPAGSRLKVTGVRFDGHVGVLEAEILGA